MSDDFDEAMKRFRREMLGPMCAHMTDEQIEAFLKPDLDLVEKANTSTEYPAWLKKEPSEG